MEKGNKEPTHTVTIGKGDFPVPNHGRPRGAVFQNQERENEEQTATRTKKRSGNRKGRKDGEPGLLELYRPEVREGTVQAYRSKSREKTVLRNYEGQDRVE